MNNLSPKETLDYLLEGKILTAELLEQFLEKNPEEGQYLDYKDGAITSPNERANGRKIIREYINSFSNSDGGILIIGVGRSTPRKIKACTPTGHEPIDKWAENCVLDMTPHFSPQPRFQIVDHPEGLVLVIAVARAISLVPCVESRKLKYFLRINQTTLEAPEYLISDLVLGKRQYPLLDLQFYDKRESKEDIEIKGDKVPSRSVELIFSVENMSLLPASEVKLGFISWTLNDHKMVINRFLLSYIDIINISDHSFGRLFHLVHDSEINANYSGIQDIDPFHQSIIKLPHSYKFPLIHKAKANCAMYIFSKGTPPIWYQLEYTYGSGVEPDIKLSRLGTGRPIVSWEC